MPEPGTETGTGGMTTSEVNRKRKSSGYVATGWDRSTRFVSSGLLVSFELTRQCQLGPWTIRRRTSGPLGLGTRGTFSHLSLSNFGCPISAPSSFPLLVPTRQLCAPCRCPPYAAAPATPSAPYPSDAQRSLPNRTYNAPHLQRTAPQRTARYP